MYAVFATPAVPAAVPAAVRAARAAVLEVEMVPLGASIGSATSRARRGAPSSAEEVVVVIGARLNVRGRVMGLGKKIKQPKKSVRSCARTQKEDFRGRIVVD
jgi:class 3 adenylate cyclase